MSIAEWTLRTDGVYERLLGPNEVGFYWDSVYRGTADTLQHAIIEGVEGEAEMEIPKESDVRAAWTSLKMRYPLLGARIEERRCSSSPSSSQALEPKPDGAESLTSQPSQATEEDIYFVVDPLHLSSENALEVVFLSCASEKETVVLEDGISNGFCWKDVREWQGAAGGWPRGDEESNARLLSNSLLACVLFIKRTDRPFTFHIMIHAAHLITDGMANSTMLSGFLDLLACRGNPPRVSMEKDALEKRLQLSVAAEALYPDLKPDYSRARRRWNRVLGKVLLALRSAKMSGGHTLPRKLRPSTPYTPAKSSHISYAFSPTHTLAILQTCKKLGITFGNAHPVLGQLGATRVLLRRRLRTLTRRHGRSTHGSDDEDIDDHEWAFRRRQPMMVGGPANLRPYLDPDWYTNGGEGNVVLSISFFFFTLPFMPLGEAGVLIDDLAAAGSGDWNEEVPYFDKLLSRARFLLRSNMIRTQSAEVFRHQRFLDISVARMPGRIERTRGTALLWRDGVSRPIVSRSEASIPAPDQPQAIGGAVLTHGGSSFGNADHLVPPYYPRAPASAHPQTRPASPTLHLIKSTTRLRCRPAELYLGAASSRGQLRLTIFWDENVYERDVVQEWLDEVVGATEWFLCADVNGVGKDTQIREDGVVIAKL
ncbi:hypothetical protein GYMLUDRAFT_39184 [Collybiopsis luxurians FD-317 M1]|nr:hypothetical protein GYMLUDRAFT_39184 [Collybiopsis luxurians FD-317 M1]